MHLLQMSFFEGNGGEQLRHLLESDETGLADGAVRVNFHSGTAAQEGGEKGRGNSEAVLRKAGFRELEIVTLDGMRHEILNENGREEVYRKILEFMEK